MIRRRSETEVEAYQDGFRAGVKCVLRLAGGELSDRTIERIELHAKILGAGV